MRKQKWKWENVVMEYCKHKTLGKCPECGENSLRVEEYESGIRYSTTFYCVKCKAFEHFDGFQRRDEK